MSTAPAAITGSFTRPVSWLVGLNLLTCLAVLAFTGLQTSPGGPQNYFNAMVYFGITAYCMLESRWSLQANDKHNSTLWFNCAWACSVAGIAHHSFWFLIWPSLPETFQAAGSLVTPVVCALAVVLLLWRGGNSPHGNSIEVIKGEPFDLGMFCFSLFASMLFVASETTHSNMTWSWISSHRPETLQLPQLGIVWLVLSSLLVFRVWPMYKLAVNNQPWNAADRGLLALAGLFMALTGIQLLWLASAHSAEVILYGSTLLVWGFFQVALTLFAMRANTTGTARNAIAIVAIGLHIGTCLIPGNIYKLVQMDVTAAQALSYVLNNALFTMGLYFAMNGFGVKVYFLTKLKRFRMRLGFKR